MLIEPDGVTRLAQQLRRPLLALDQRHVAQIVALMLDQVEREQYGVVIARALKSDSPSSRQITASPSIRNDDALRRLAASTIAGKRSAQSVTTLRITTHPRPFAAHPQPKAVMLDFVDPQGIGRRGRAAFDGRHGSTNPDERRDVFLRDTMAER